MYSPAFSWPHSSLITNQKQPGGPSPSLAGSPTLLPAFFLFCSPRPFLESSRLSSKGSQAVTCLPDPFPLLFPFLLSGSWRCPGRILRFATFVRSYLPSIHDFSQYPILLSPLPSLYSSFLFIISARREKERGRGRERKCVMYL